MRGKTRYTHFKTGDAPISHLAILFVSSALNLALSGCGRIGFEQIAAEESIQERENDAIDAIDARTNSDSGIPIRIDADIDASTDAASVMDSEAADTESVFNADEDDAVFDAGEDVEELDAAYDANESDAVSPTNAADGADEEPCVLSAVTYTEDEVAELSGTLSIRAMHSDKCAAVDGDSTGWGADVVQQGCDYSMGQLWEPIDVGEGRYGLRSSIGGHCIEPNGRDTSEGVVVGLWDCWLPDTQQVQAICAGYDEWRIFNRASNLSLTVRDASVHRRGIRRLRLGSKLINGLDSGTS